MLERKKTSPKGRSREFREFMLAYESAMSPLILPLVLGFAGYWICDFFKFPVAIGLIAGFILGFVVGLRRLVVFLKNRNKNEDKVIQESEDKS
ncbi:MAG: hypothetical protein QNJ31_05195 [Candidatus Caenarcaniphilales bacterium]|nr:hypothetical protein [Candidatus Caenarcaniphilales bacterium]